MIDTGYLSALCEFSSCLHSKSFTCLETSLQPGTEDLTPNLLAFKSSAISCGILSPVRVPEFS